MPAAHQYRWGASSTPAPWAEGQKMCRGKGAAGRGAGPEPLGCLDRGRLPFPQPHLCSLSRRYFSRSALLIFSSGCKWSWCVFTFWLST